MKRSLKTKKENDIKRPALASNVHPTDDLTINSVSSTTDAGDSASITPSSSKISSKDVPSNKLPLSFYDKPCEVLAKNLLGQKLVTINSSGQRIVGKILETEGYLGIIDKAAHSFKGKRTEKTEAMFMPPGTCYVYNIYGMYCCMNISSKGEGAAVLLRALEPVEGLDLMEEIRVKNKKSIGDNKPMKTHALCNGPSKLCQALGITKKSCNKEDLTLSSSIFLEKGETIHEDQIVVSSRVNIGYADDWKDKPLRFYIIGNKAVSVRDKAAEKLMAEKAH